MRFIWNQVPKAEPGNYVHNRLLNAVLFRGLRVHSLPPPFSHKHKWDWAQQSRVWHTTAKMEDCKKLNKYGQGGKKQQQFAARTNRTFRNNGHVSLSISLSLSRPCALTGTFMGRQKIKPSPGPARAQHVAYLIQQQTPAGTAAATQNTGKLSQRFP